MKSKSSKIRSMLRAGQTPKQIAELLKCPVQTVYSVSWKMRKDAKKKRIVISKSEADLAKKLAIPIKAYAKQKLKMQQEDAQAKEQVKRKPLAEFVLHELVNLEHQIDRLNTIRSFLSLRLQQLEQNGE